VQNLSYENEFYLHVNGNSLSHERLCSKTRFEKEVQDNSEMAYFFQRFIAQFISVGAQTAMSQYTKIEELEAVIATQDLLDLLW